MNKKLAQSQLVTKRADSNLPRSCKRIKVTLLKLKGCFICIKNDLIDDHFFLSLYSKTIWLERLNFSNIAVNVCVGLSSERETATAKYVGVNKLIREILIEIAPFHILHMIKLLHIKIRKTSSCLNSSVKVNNPPSPTNVILSLSVATWVWMSTLNKVKGNIGI